MSATIVPERLTAHFTRDELACPCCGQIHMLNAKLVALCLERIRSGFGPMIVVSGHRCPVHNAHVHGKPDSEHLSTLAADIRVQSDRQRYLLVMRALQCDVRRIGVHLGFIHLGFSLKHPQDVLWTYPT